MKLRWVKEMQGIDLKGDLAALLQVLGASPGTRPILQRPKCLHQCTPFHPALHIQG